MKATISEHKKEILMGYIKSLEDGLCDLLHNVETDETIPDEAWESIQEATGKLFSELNQLRETVIFS